MTKNFFFASAVAVSMMALASCSSEDVMPVGDDNTVTFTAQLPETAVSRAYSDGTGATVLKYAVYESGKLIMTDQSANAPQGDYTASNKTFTLKLQLAKGKTYDFAFWAQATDAPYDFVASATDETVTVNMKYDTDATANNEKRDAFFNVEKGVLVDGAIQKNIELRRPFGRLAVGTSDYDAWKKAVNAETDLGNIAVKVTDVYNSLDLFSGVAGDPKEITFTDVKPEVEEVMTIEGDETEYMYLAMDYILTGTEVNGTEEAPVVNEAQQETKDVNITINDNAGNELCSIPVSAVPFQRNYRTNIYGALLTAPLEYIIKVVPDFYIPDKNVPVVEVSTAEELVNALSTPNANVILADDIVITSGSLNLKKKATIDLNGHSLQTAGGTYGDAFEIAQNSTVVVKNGVIKPATGSKANCGIFYVSHNTNLTLENVKIEGDVYSIPVYLNGTNTNINIISSDIKSGRTQVVYIDMGAKGGSKVTIEGGRYEAVVKPNETMATFTLNLSDDLTKLEGFKATNFIEVKGGTFVKYDPAHSKSENPEVSFVAEGYKSVDNGDGTFTVVKE